MSDQTADPQQAAPFAATPPQPAPEPPPVEAQEAWIDGYVPGNPWQARLCLRTPHGTVAYPLTPYTMPDLLEGLVVVAQEQQGITGDDALTVPGPGSGSGPVPGHGPGPDDPFDEDRAAPAERNAHEGRAARLTGWALVHSLWEREDPRFRIAMGAVVAVLFLVGILLT